MWLKKKKRKEKKSSHIVTERRRISARSTRCDFTDNDDKDLQIHQNTK